MKLFKYYARDVKEEMVSEETSTIPYPRYPIFVSKDDYGRHIVVGKSNIYISTDNMKTYENII